MNSGGSIAGRMEENTASPNTTSNPLKRCRACVAAGGGHLKQRFKKLYFNTCFYIRAGHLFSFYTFSFFLKDQMSPFRKSKHALYHKFSISTTFQTEYTYFWILLP